MSDDHRRVRSLDGLRGVAALVVVICHSLLTIPALAAAYYPGISEPPERGSAAWILAFTPVHVLWQGGAAVIVFFVLSGVVLTLPVLGHPRFNWLAYFPRRAVRLYLPVFAAVAFGSLLAVAVDRGPADGLSVWIRSIAESPTLTGVTKDVTLVRGVSGLVSPLWSLQWEVLFSVLLPIYLYGGRILPSLWPLKICGLLLLIAAGSLMPNSYFAYLPVFAIGVVLAFEFDRARAFAERFNGAAWVGVGAMAVLCTTSPWMLADVSHTDAADAAGRVLLVVGATLFVFIAAFAPRAVGALTSPSLQWLGRISFSLYLVHQPITVAVAVALGPDRTWLNLPIMVVVGPFAGYVFYRLVEKPSHLAARRVGRALSGSNAANRAPVVDPLEDGRSLQWLCPPLAPQPCSRRPRR